MPTPPQIYNSPLQDGAAVRIIAKLWTSQQILRRLMEINYKKCVKMPRGLLGAVKCKIVDLNTLSAQTKKKLMSLVNPVGDALIKWIRDNEEFFDSLNSTILFTTNLRWTNSGAVDERATADVMTKNDEIDLKKRYVIACIYCMEPIILNLWNRLHRTGFDVIDGEQASRYPLAAYWNKFLESQKVAEEECTKKSNDCRSSSEDIPEDHVVTSKPPVRSCPVKNSTSGSLGLNSCFPKRVDEETVTLHRDNGSTCSSNCSKRLQMSKSSLHSSHNNERSEDGVNVTDGIVKIVDTRCYRQKILVCQKDTVLDLLMNCAVQSASGGEPWLELGFQRGKFSEFIFQVLDVKNRLKILDREFEGGSSKEDEDGTNSRMKKFTCFDEWPVQWFFLDVINKKWVMFTVEMSDIQFAHSCRQLRNEPNCDYHKIFEDLWNQIKINQWTMKMNAVEQDVFEYVEGNVTLNNFKNSLPVAEDKLAVKIRPKKKKQIDVDKANSEYTRKMYDLCPDLVVIQRLDFIQELVENCLPTSNKFIKQWKREFMFSDDGLSSVSSLLKKDKWDAIEKLLNWSFEHDTSLTTVYKTHFIMSRTGCKMCMDLVSKDKWDDFQRLTSWSATPAENILHAVYDRIDLFIEYIELGDWKAVEKNLNWCLFDVQDVKDFQVKFKQAVQSHRLWLDRKSKAPEQFRAVISRLLSVKGPDTFQETFVVFFLTMFIFSVVFLNFWQALRGDVN